MSPAEYETLIKKLARRVQALETERIFKDTKREVPNAVLDELLETAGAVQEAKRLDWVQNIGI